MGKAWDGADIVALTARLCIACAARRAEWQSQVDHCRGGKYDLARQQTARSLLGHGARVDAVNDDQMTSLAFALQQCGKEDIEKTAAMAQLLLQAHSNGEQVYLVTAGMRESVQRIGTDFESHRSNFNPDSLEAASAALDQLYTLISGYYTFTNNDGVI